jgi:hypothetical protein
MKRGLACLLMLGPAALGFAMPPSGSAQCAGQPADLVEVTMNWCAADQGFNEGATCGRSALSLVGISGLPPVASQSVLGSTWDRTHMMGATLLAYHKGSVDLAVTSAICCQVQNGPVFTCLQARRAEIASWLDSQ